MVKNKLKSIATAALFGALALIGSIAPYAGTATVIAGAAALSAPTPAAAETTWSSMQRADGTLISIVVYLNQEGDFVQSGILDFAWANNIDIMIEAGPGLVIQEIDGVLVAVRF